MKFFNNIRLQIYFTDGVSIRDDDWWLVNFSYDGMNCCKYVRNKYYDVNGREELKIVGVDEI